MKTLHNLSKHLSAVEIILLKNNIQAIGEIYRLVLKHGWLIRLEHRLDGGYSFRMTDKNPGNFTEDWQPHELPFVKQSFAVLHPIGSNND